MSLTPPLHTILHIKEWGGHLHAGREKVLKVKKGPWTPDEDRKLLAYIQNHGHGSWPALPSKAGLRRCGKSCRLRWINYLRPDIKRGNFSLKEEQTIIQLHALLGNRWSVIATHLPKRTDNEIKNYWNTRIKKTLTKSGIDPITHKPIITHSGALLGSGKTKHDSNLNHVAQWETACLEAEARLSTQRSKTLMSDEYDPYQVQHHEYRKSSARDQLVGMPALISPRSQPQQPLCLDVLNVWQRIMSSDEAFDGSVEHYTPASAFSFLDSQGPIPPSGQMTSISNFLDNDALSNYPIHVDQYTSAINCAIKQNIKNDLKILKPNNSTNLRDIKEMMENPIKLHYCDEMTNPVSCFIDTFTSNFTESCCDDFELENWNSVPSNLANYSATGLTYFAESNC